MIQKSHRFRVFVLLITFISLFLIVGFRLYLIQVHQKDFFKILAKQQHKMEITVNPERALIYDRDRTPLTLNRESISAFVVPREVKNHKKTMKFIKKYFYGAYKKLKRSPVGGFLWLQRNISEKKLKKIEDLKLSDIHILKEPSRFYPFNGISQVVGFTNIDNKGMSGIEMQFDKMLSGRPTRMTLGKDARSGQFYFDKEVVDEGETGEIVELSLDNKIQFLVYEELKKTVKDFNARFASVVVMNPDNGNIIVMANYPSFNANKKINNIENTKNRVVTDCFEFGSVMKAFTALTALSEKVTTLDEEIDCEGRVAYVDGFRVENWKPFDLLSFSDSIRYSTNVGPAKIAMRLGPKIYTHLKLLGFGSLTNIRFPGERSGFVNPPHNWSKHSQIVMSFGYEIMATVLQLAKAFCVIANGGYQVDPVLVNIPHRSKNASKKKIYTDKAIRDIKSILQDIGDKYFNFPGYKVMGKTGTARSMKNGKYSRRQHLYSFGGIVEKGDYKRVVVAFVKEPKEKKGDPNLWASQVTVPLFRNVVERLIIHDLT